MKLSEIKNEQAIDVLGEILPSFHRIATNEEITKIRSRDKYTYIELASAILKNCKSDILFILATLDGKTVETYECTLVSLFKDIFELITEPEIQDLFTLQS